MHRFSKKQIRQQNLLALVIVALFLAVGVCVHGYFNYSLTPVNKNSQKTKKVIIPRNSTDQQVSTILKRQELVRSRYVFYYYLQTHKTNGVKAGTFTLKQSQSVPEITVRLQENRHAKKH